ncbi:PREDICTED: gamma-aminobutyric acid receptor alpha-like [Priapulus caudatus]|uniref:Gamma-aminobutyric acid receptor alpha-like n=1 Tax=Priapulus caudatus TaxID=37621 RepID=A0ABM1F8J8_PRICU|nr:PREDICTED: gamma-aminobutyric acid receptor alpha-like [Priapulus caudatus]
MSKILDGLLDGYDKRLRPGYGGPNATIIFTNVYVRSMGPISEMDMQYQMDCYFRQRWFDDRLMYAGPYETLTISIQFLKNIWKPDTFFQNGKDSYVHTITAPNKLLRVSQSGEVFYSMRLTIKASCPMRLQKFPMDQQLCPLVVGSYSYPVRDLVYRWEKPENVAKPVDFQKNLELSQFQILKTPYMNTTMKYRNDEFSVLKIQFHLSRHTGYFLIQIYLPCILLVVLSWVSFWLNREATADRVGLGITTVLTLSTFSTDSRTDLPKVSYATSLDWFLVMCFMFVIATLLEYAGVHYFTKVGSGERFTDTDIDWEDVDEEQEYGYGDTPDDDDSDLKVNHMADVDDFCMNRSDCI